MIRAYKSRLARALDAAAALVEHPVRSAYGVSGLYDGAPFTFLVQGTSWSWRTESTPRDRIFVARFVHKDRTTLERIQGVSAVAQASRNAHPIFEHSQHHLSGDREIDDCLYVEGPHADILAGLLLLERRRNLVRQELSAIGLGARLLVGRDYFYEYAIETDIQAALETLARLRRDNDALAFEPRAPAPQTSSALVAADPYRSLPAPLPRDPAFIAGAQAVTSLPLIFPTMSLQKAMPFAFLALLVSSIGRRVPVLSRAFFVLVLLVLAHLGWTLAKQALWGKRLGRRLTRELPQLPPGRVPDHDALLDRLWRGRRVP